MRETRIGGSAVNERGRERGLFASRLSSFCQTIFKIFLSGPVLRRFFNQLELPHERAGRNIGRLVFPPRSPDGVDAGAKMVGNVLARTLEALSASLHGLINKTGNLVIEARRVDLGWSTAAGAHARLPVPIATTFLSSERNPSR